MLFYNLKIAILYHSYSTLFYNILTKRISLNLYFDEKSDLIDKHCLFKKTTLNRYIS